MADCTRLTLTKEFTYRDALEEFANSYVWKQAGPPDDSTNYYTNLLQSVLATERPIFPSSVKFVHAYAWNLADPHASHVFYHDYRVPGPPPVGTFAPGTELQAAGDQAACVVWPAALKSSTGKPVYFRKYFHSPFFQPGDQDELGPVYKNALGIYIASGLDTLNGGFTNQLPAKAYGALAQYRNVAIPGHALTYITTRTLKRRGKRPRPA